MGRKEWNDKTNKIKRLIERRGWDNKLRVAYYNFEHTYTLVWWNKTTDIEQLKRKYGKSLSTIYKYKIEKRGSLWGKILGYKIIYENDNSLPYMEYKKQEGEKTNLERIEKISKAKRKCV